MRPSTLFLIASFVFAQSAFAADQCSAIEDPAKRLTCYDNARGVNSEKADQTRANMEKLAEFVKAAKSRTADLLTDPESARFTKLYVLTSTGSGVHILCGSVNSKNKVGGYDGPKRFMSAEQGNETIVYGLASGFDAYIAIKRIQKMCQRSDTNFTVAEID